MYVQYILIPPTKNRKFNQKLLPVQTMLSTWELLLLSLWPGAEGWPPAWPEDDTQMLCQHMSAHLCHNIAISVIAKDSCLLQWHHVYAMTCLCLYRVWSVYGSSDPHPALSIKLCLVLHSINLVRQMDRQDPVCHWFLLITISWRSRLTLRCDLWLSIYLCAGSVHWWRSLTSLCTWVPDSEGGRGPCGGGQGVELGGRGEHSVQLRGQQAGTWGGTGGWGQTLHCQHRVHRVVCRAPGRKKNTLILQCTAALSLLFVLCSFQTKNLKKNIFPDLYTLWCPNYLLSCLGRVALELEERDLELGPG